MASERPSNRPQEDLVGQTIAQFRVVAKLGEGGMGIVYKAIDEELRRTVALKMLPHGVVGNDERRRRFLREARAAAAITHPNIAAVYEIGEVGGRPFIAMEFVPGASLREVLARGRIDLSEALRIAKAVARALVKAHARGVVHRDLKPDNVMIGEDGEIKVLDFGLARFDKPDEVSKSVLETDETASHVTADGHIVGTAGYMSPEQALGKDVDHRTDLFSLGAMLFEMTTGVRPFRGAGMLEIVIAATRDDPGPASAHNAEVRPRLDAVIARCLAKRAGDRFATARDFARALDEVDGLRLSIPDDTGSAPALDADILPSSVPSVASQTRGAPLPATTSLVSATAPVAPARSKRLSAWAIGTALAVVVGSAGVATWRFTATPPQVSAPIPSMSARPSPSTPIIADAEAVQLYERGVQKMHGGNWRVGCALVRRAADRDVAFTMAAYRFAVCYARVGPSVGREYFRRAFERRDELDDESRTFLGALEPIYQRYPADSVEHVRRLRAALERHPRSALMRLFYGSALAQDDWALGLAELERAREIDPLFVRPLQLEAEYLSYMGRIDEARSMLAKCLELAPGANDCTRELLELDVSSGDCAALETRARGMILAEPDALPAYVELANALAARGGPLEASREVLRQKREHMDPRDRPTEELRDEAALAMFMGDFTAAIAAVGRLEALVASVPAIGEHAWPARARCEAALESGSLVQASAAATSFLQRRDAWESDARAEDWAISEDPTGSMLWTLQHAGALSPEEASKRRAAWLVAWEARVQTTAHNFLWLHQWAAGVETADDASTALAALPRFSPLPPHKPKTLADAYAGRTFLVGGRVDDALPYLRAATRSCAVLDFAYDGTRARFDLGRALEAKGDAAGACAAYASVRARWGAAKPRSITAERAKAQMTALRCPAPSGK